MIQSIAKEKYDVDIFRDFGLVIFDEAHHAPSKYFSRALPLIACKKTLALSATPKRSDKLEKVLYWYLGPIIFKNEQEENTTVLAKIYKYKIEHEKFVEKKIIYSGEVNIYYDEDTEKYTIEAEYTGGNGHLFDMWFKSLTEQFGVEFTGYLLISPKLQLHLNLLTKKEEFGIAPITKL
jgi:superfamily II DNA or RNA helicase